MRATLTASWRVADHSYSALGGWLPGYAGVRLVRENALIEGAAVEHFRQFGDDQLEPVFSQVRLHPADECTGDHHACPVAGDPVLEHQVSVIPPAAVVLNQADARVEAVEGAVAARSGQRPQSGGSIDSAQTARGVAAGLHPVENPLTTRAR